MHIVKIMGLDILQRFQVLIFSKATSDSSKKPEVQHSNIVEIKTPSQPAPDFLVNGTIWVWL